MLASRFKSQTISATLLLFHIFVLVVADDPVQTPESDQSIPSIWSKIDDGYFYHIRYNLEIEKHDEVLRIEEWASFEDQMFRLDLITESGRKSYLTNGKTGEIFFYKPFVCELLDKQSKDFEIFAKLFLGYPLIKPRANGEPNEVGDGVKLAYGLGPLWLKAQNEAKVLKEKFAQVKDKYGLLYTKKYRQYSLKFDQIDDAKQTSRINLIFDEQLLLDIAVWLMTDSNGTLERAALAKLSSFDVRKDLSVFKLPVGFGCVRDDKLDQPLRLDVGQVLLHTSKPNQVIFDIKTSTPLDEQLEKWHHRDYSVTMSRFALKRELSQADTENYFVTMFQERDESSGQLRRSKRVWWTPTNDMQNKVNNANEESGPKNHELALVYEIDLVSGKCQAAYKNVNDQLVLEFPNNDSVALSVDQVSFLFADSSHYHLIDEGEQFGNGRVRGLVFEKRLKHFQLRSSGQVKWDGSVSIIKLISSHSRYLDERFKKRMTRVTRVKKDQTLTLSSDYSVTLTILFYSENFDKVHHKAVIELAGNHEIGYNYLHKQMDVSGCFKSEQQHDIVLRYPIEDPKEITALDANRDQLYLRLFSNLFDQTSISPFQISSIDISFDFFNMYLKMKVLDLPLNQMFSIARGFKLSLEKADRQILVSVTASTLEKCADHCEHYGCFRFAYDAKSLHCYIELVEGKAEVTADGKYDLFTYVHRPTKDKRTVEMQLKGHTSTPYQQDVDISRLRPHFSSRSIIEMFQEMLDDEVDLKQERNQDSADENPLNLRVAIYGQRGQKSLLKPAFLGHDLESMNEFVKELVEGSDSSDQSAGEQSSNRETQLDDYISRFSDQMKLEYELIMEDRALANMKVNKVRTGLSYEQCAAHCENTDCRSFSYCRDDSGECQVSNIHQEKLILKHSESRAYADRCAIYSLDYLSKFELFGRAQLATVVRSSVDVRSPRDCANLCMDTTNFTCQGFYYCKMKATSISSSSDIYRCHTTDIHANVMVDDVRNHNLKLEDPDLVPSNELSLSTGRECWFYSRSYMAQFDKFYGKKLELMKSTSFGDNVVVMGLDSEQCAKRCIQYNCLAFDICPRKNDLVSGQTCQMAIKQFGQKQLKADKQCTTFVLSDKSQFNKLKRGLIDEDSKDKIKPDKEASVDRLPSNRSKTETLDTGESSTTKAPVQGNEDGSIDLGTWDPSGSDLKLLESSDELRLRTSVANPPEPSFWAKTGSFFIGLGAGSFLVAFWNEAYARGWLSRTQDGIRQLITSRR